MGKSQGTPLLAAGGDGPASPAYGCVKPRLAFSLESPRDESGGQARETKLKSFPSEAPGRFTRVSVHIRRTISRSYDDCLHGHSLHKRIRFSCESVASLDGAIMVMQIMKNNIAGGTHEPRSY